MIFADPSYNSVAFPFSHSPRHMLENAGSGRSKMLGAGRRRRAAAAFCFITLDW